MDKKTAKILITGGHFTPALSVYNELKKRGYTNFIWVGTKHNQAFSRGKTMEYITISETLGVKFYNLIAGKLWRRWVRVTFFKALISLIQIPIGFIQAVFIILFEKPTLIISFGGYIALPIVIVGKLFKVQSVTHEQTVTSGLANRIIAKYADLVFVSWEESLKTYPESKTFLTGNPLRDEIFKVDSKKFVFDNSLPIVYVTGGNQGSTFVNKMVMTNLENILSEANVIHQTGASTVTKEYEKALELKAKLTNKFQKRYRVVQNIFSDNIGEVMAKANLIITRSGANIVSEIIALNKYALFIPIPWSSNNEQMHNAEFAQKQGNGDILKQNKKMTNKEFLSSYNRSMVTALKRDSRPNKKYINASKAICDLIESKIL